MRRVVAAAVVLILCSAPSVLSAKERRFTYVYESTTMPKGDWEYEQWVTWKTDKQDDSTYDRLEFRHEFEWGITDRLQLAIYAGDWRYTSGKSVNDDGTEFRDVAFEVIYSLTDPVTDPIGAALYGEVKIGDELFEIEGKLLLQKNIGKWVLAWNLTLEAEWEGEEYNELKGAFAQSAGVSYQFSPQLSAGAELVHEIEFPGWGNHAGEPVLYFGPNVSYRGKGWWVTVTPLAQLTDVGGEPNFQMRLLIGVDLP